MIITSSFNIIYDIWAYHLWPERTSKIEPHSAMLLNGTYDIGNFKYKPSFFLYLHNDKIAGCNSGHMCVDNSYRSRGLYVFPEYRNMGIGQKLLSRTIDQAKTEKADYIWSYPKQSSWKTYNSVGFNLYTDWEQSELGQNAYCTLDIKSPKD